MRWQEWCLAHSDALPRTLNTLNTPITLITTAPKQGQATTISTQANRTPCITLPVLRVLGKSLFFDGPARDVRLDTPCPDSISPNNTSSIKRTTKLPIVFATHRLQNSLSTTSSGAKAWAMDDRHATATIFVDAPSLTADGAPRRCEGRCKVPGSAASKLPDPPGLLSPSSPGDWTLDKETADPSGFQTVRLTPSS